MGGIIVREWDGDIRRREDSYCKKGRERRGGIRGKRVEWERANDDVNPTPMPGTYVQVYAENPELTSDALEEKN